jgi:hypothetical protein
MLLPACFKLLKFLRTERCKTQKLSYHYHITALHSAGPNCLYAKEVDRYGP